ncbi:MAG: SRPBCC family protein [Armatimonas sp.]
MIEASQAEVWNFHASLGVLEILTPPGTKITLPEPKPELKQGARFTIIVRQPPVFLPLAWESVFTIYEPPVRFVDEQGRKGPWKSWRHEHRFEAVDNRTTKLIDSIDYEPPFGILGRIADALFLRRILTNAFAFRHQKTKDLLQSAINAKTDT